MKNLLVFENSREKCKKMPAACQENQNKYFWGPWAPRRNLFIIMYDFIFWVGAMWPHNDKNAIVVSKIYY